ncbi:unnamed protein product [Orchesella dallaii]|uniref:Protein kinase domain-containing protein n=1 Tax=Orchesella dallaii TaxID=48710 RepID=A0ABP1QHE2_9HEXA
MVKMITPTLGAVIRPSVSLSKLSQTEKEKGKVQNEILTIQQKQQTLPPQLSQYHQQHPQINIHDNYMAHILSDPGAVRSLDDFRMAQVYHSDSVMLVHDKLSHLALSVPDISSHCYQQQQNQYNAVQHQAPMMGQWTTASVPSHTVVQVIPGGTTSKKLNSSAMNGSAVVPVAINDDGSQLGPHHDDNATNSSDPQSTGLVLPNHSKANGGWFNGLLGCLRPVWTIIGKATAHDHKFHGNQSIDEWDIPFEHISDLEWLGSGAQGAVFKGKLRGEWVAVKKVKDLKETDIKHLRKLNHANVIQFKGVCTQTPLYCIIMEYCPQGTLYGLINRGDDLPPQKLVDWSKQIANGMFYLHAHKIIHRDLKSPNVLIGSDEIAKISDFGTSRQWNEVSTRMSFAGTVPWMAPEIIRNEPCSEKVDIWSFGVVLWELLTCETPYKDVDSSAIMFGVGNNSLHLPLPSSCPEGYKLLIKQCCSPKPRNRPSFKHIILHLEIASDEILATPPDQYLRMQKKWKEELTDQMKKARTRRSHSKAEDAVIRKRKEELKHAQDIREHYLRKLERTNHLYLELSAFLTSLEQREQDLRKREQQIGVGGTPSKYKRRFKPLFKTNSASASFANERGYGSSGRKRTAFLVSSKSNGDSTSPASPEQVIYVSSYNPAQQTRHQDEDVNDGIDFPEEGMKTKDLYTELNPSDKPESTLREPEGMQNQMSSCSTSSTLPSSKNIGSMLPELKSRSRRYKHRRSKSHENYAKIMSPRHSPHVERHCMTPLTPVLPHSLSFRASMTSNAQMTTSETQTEESSFAESLNGTGGFSSSRQLHLNIPTSPSSNYRQQSDDKVTDMSLGSEASSSKTPGGGYDTYQKQKTFANSTLEEEDHGCEDTHEEENHEQAKSARQTIMKRSVSSTLDEEEEDDDLLDDEDPRHRNSSNNNNEYHNGESSDDMLDTLEGCVGQLIVVKNGNGRRRGAACRCKCHLQNCHAAAKIPVAASNGYPPSTANGRSGSQLTEEEEEEEEGAFMDEDTHTAVSAHGQRSDYGRSESNETLDSKDTNSSSREDVFAEDGFETFSDEEAAPPSRLGIHMDFLKRKSMLRKPVARRRSRLQTHPQQGRPVVGRTASTLSSEDDLTTTGRPSQP